MSKEYSDHELESAVREGLALELNGQLGRAGQAFEAHLKLAGAAAPVGFATRSQSTRARLWMIGGIGTAVAASMAAVWAIPLVGPQTGTPMAVATQPFGGPGEIPSVEMLPSVTTVDASADDAPQWEQVEHVVNSMTLDRGPVVLEDNTPGQLVRRVALEETEWVDERRGVRVRAVVPRQDVQLISLDTY